MMRRLVAVTSATLLTLVVGLAVPPASGRGGQPWVEKAQRRLNALHCNAGPADGTLGTWTRSGVIRFQSRHGLPQSGNLTAATRTRLYADHARRCDLRPVPKHSGVGRRIVLSQRQNWVWLVGPKGGVVAQEGMVDNTSVLRPGSYGTGSYCGRAARIRKNSTSSNQVWLENFVRFAPCGVGFHRIPTYQSNGVQMHPDWYLGTNLTQSHGCIRLSKGMSLEVWRFTTHRTRVRVV